MVVPPVYRRHPALASVVALLLFAALLDHLVVPHQQDDYRRYHGRVFRVARVVSGTDLEIDCPDRRAPVTLVCLWGLAVPGLDSDEDPPDLPAAEAAASLSAMLHDTDVRLELSPTRSRDDERRLLAYAYRMSDGQSVNEMLLEEGFVTADPALPHPFAKRYQGLQDRAQRRGLGLWARAKTAPATEADTSLSLR